MSASNVRSRVKEVPGPCAHWNDDDADFIRETLDRVGDKWTILVVGTLQGGARRYSELAAAIPGISQRMLTLTLRHLHRDGLVTRTAFAEVPPRVEYELTELGQSLLSAVLELATWAATHHDDIRRHRDAFPTS